ncbi:MAG: type II toxin-antitoxin system VapC family toxin [Anaerolineae bacterium]|nr:type II toxin-antitoxin system VapC family toxin [Anaerolineae bacterium]
MIVTDASVWVSRFLPEDSFHQASRAWLIETATAGVALVAPTIMLAEVSGSIARRTGNEQLGYQIVQQIRQLPTLQLITVDDTLGQLAAQVASSYRLRGADAVYLAVAQRLQIPLVSWDREQLDRAAALVTTYQPDEAPGPAEK